MRNLIFRKPLNGWEILVELLKVLEQFKDLSTAGDSLRWIVRDKVILRSDLLTKCATLPKFKLKSGNGS